MFWKVLASHWERLALHVLAPAIIAGVVLARLSSMDLRFHPKVNLDFASSRKDQVDTHQGPSNQRFAQLLYSTVQQPWATFSAINAARNRGRVIATELRLTSIRRLACARIRTVWFQPRLNYHHWAAYTPTSLPMVVAEHIRGQPYLLISLVITSRR